MATIRLNVDVQGSDQNVALLDAVRASLNPDEITAAGATMILNRTRQRYLAEKDPQGRAWVPSQAGIRRRRRGGTGTMFLTGTLFRSIQLIGASGQGNLFGDFAERVIVAGALAKAGYDYGVKHQKGKWPFMGINQGDIELFEAYLRARVAKALGVG